MIVFPGATTSSDNNNNSASRIPLPDEPTNNNDMDDVANDILVLSNAFHAAQVRV